MASSITSRFDPDDLVQEAYARIFQAIERGGGPTGSFRAYLFTSIRHTAAGWGRRDREVPIDEVEAIADPDAEAHATDEALDRSLTAQAYRSLPTRWQEVLWYTEIEQMKPAAVAPLLGMNATAVAQLAFRAREGLREAWIQAHLRSAPEGSACRWTIERLGAYARGNLGRRDTGKVDAHLAECARCGGGSGRGRGCGCGCGCGGRGCGRRRHPRRRRARRDRRRRRARRRRRGRRVHRAVDARRRLDRVDGCLLDRRRLDDSARRRRAGGPHSGSLSDRAALPHRVAARGGAAADRRRRRRSGCDSRPRSHAPDGGASGDARAGPDALGIPHTQSDADGHSDPHPHAHSHGHTHGDSDTDSHADADADT